MNLKQVYVVEEAFTFLDH